MTDTVVTTEYHDKELYDQVVEFVNKEGCVTADQIMIEFKLSSIACLTIITCMAANDLAKANPDGSSTIVATNPATTDTPNNHNEVGGIAADRLRSFIERIERLEEEKKALADDIKEVYSEAKGSGFDIAVMRIIIKDRKLDTADRRERDEIVALYMRALNMEF